MRSADWEISEENFGKRRKFPLKKMTVKKKMGKNYNDLLIFPTLGETI